MKTFSQIRQSLSEGLKLSSGEKEVKSMKVGKGKKFPAVITKKGSAFIAYIDGDKLDEFKSQKEAEKAIMDFTKLMDK
jgi:hypothetical protein